MSTTDMSSAPTPRKRHLGLKITGAIISAGVLLGSAATVASASTRHYDGHCSAQGQYATCVASGTANRPSSMFVYVRTGTRQSIKVFWDVTCWKGTGAGSRSGSFTVYTPARHKISHPYSRPDGCSVAADAQINHGSSIQIQNSYFRW